MRPQALPPKIAASVARENCARWMRVRMTGRHRCGTRRRASWRWICPVMQTRQACEIEWLQQGLCAACVLLVCCLFGGACFAPYLTRERCGAGVRRGLGGRWQQGCHRRQRLRAEAVALVGAAAAALPARTCCGGGWCLLVEGRVQQKVKIDIGCMLQRAGWRFVQGSDRANQMGIECGR